MDVSSSASPARGQHAYQCDPAQDAHGPTPRATSNPEAQLPASNNTSNDEPEGSDPEDTGVCCPVAHETGDGVEPAHDNHAHETHPLDGIGETPTGLRLQPRALPSETPGGRSPDAPTIMTSTPGESSASSSSVAGIRDPCLGAARQGSSSPLTTHRDPHHSPDLSGLAREALAAAAQTSKLPNIGLAIPPSEMGRDSIVAPLSPPLARLSSDQQEDPRNPQTTQIFHRPSDEIQPSSSVSAQPSAARTFPYDSTPAWRARQMQECASPTWSVSLGQTLPSQLITKPRPSALWSSVGQERGGTSLPNFGSLPAPRHHQALPLPTTPLQQPFRPPVLHPKSSDLRPLLPRLNHGNESSPADRDGRYPCTVCSRKFNRSIVMETHLEVEHGIKLPPRERGDLRFLLS